MDPSEREKKVLIVCTGNACRSQMAEAVWRHVAGDRYLVTSAGTSPAGVHPLARDVVEELGIDMSGHYSKSVFDLDAREFDVVITVCDDARAVCLSFPGHPCHLHWPVEDPVGATGTLEERLREFRRVRDILHQRIVDYLKEAGVRPLSP